MGNYVQLGVYHANNFSERDFRCFCRCLRAVGMFESIICTGMRTSRNSHAFKLISGCA